MKKIVLTGGKNPSRQIQQQQSQLIDISERASFANSDQYSMNNICSSRIKIVDHINQIQQERQFQSHQQQQQYQTRETKLENQRQARNSIVNLLKLSKKMQRNDYYNRFRKGSLLSQKQEIGQIKNSSVMPDEKKPEIINLWNVLRQLNLIRRFVSKVKLQSAFQSYWKLTKNHFTLIKDKASFYQKEGEKLLLEAKKSSTFLLFTHQFIWILKKIKVFQPDSTFILAFRLVFFLTLLIQLFQIPLIMSFRFKEEEQYEEREGNFTVGTAFSLIPVVLCFFDVALKFNIAYYEEGQIITEQKMIITKYLKTYCLFDVISTLAVIPYSGTDKWIQILFVFRLYQVEQLLEYIEERFQLQHQFSTQWTLIKLIFQVILTAHVCCCAFHQIAQWEISNGETNTWLHVQKIDISSWQIRYLYALYYTFITQATVGYGDITPTTPFEKMYAIIVTLISCGQFGYVINTIGQIFLESAQKQANYKQKKYEIANYMRQREINSQLQIQVFKYLDYIQGKESEAPQKGQEILEGVSKKLRQDVYRDFFGKKLRSSKLFTINFSSECINDLSLRFREVLYGPGEVIYAAGELDLRIFFVIKGGVELYLENQKQEKFTSCYIENNDFFGQVSFFTGLQRDTYARSTKVSHLIYCTSEDFISILKQYPQDYEQFCMMKDSLLMQKKLIHIQCSACQKFNHSIIDCPMMHFVKSKEYIIRKYNHSQSHKERQSMFTRSRQKFKTFQENDKVKIALKIIRYKCIQKAHRVQEKKRNRQIQQELVQSDCSIEDNDRSSQQSSESSEYSISNSLQEQIIERKSDKFFFLQNPGIKIVGGHCLTVNSCSYTESSSMSSSEEEDETSEISESKSVSSMQSIDEEEEFEQDADENDNDLKRKHSVNNSSSGKKGKKLSQNFPFQEINVEDSNSNEVGKIQPQQFQLKLDKGLFEQLPEKKSIISIQSKLQIQNTIPNQIQKPDTFNYQQIADPEQQQQQNRNSSIQFNNQLEAINDIILKYKNSNKLETKKENGYKKATQRRIATMPSEDQTDKNQSSQREKLYTCIDDSDDQDSQADNNSKKKWQPPKQLQQLSTQQQLQQQQIRFMENADKKNKQQTSKQSYSNNWLSTPQQLAIFDKQKVNENQENIINNSNSQEQQQQSQPNQLSASQQGNNKNEKNLERQNSHRKKNKHSSHNSQQDDSPNGLQGSSTQEVIADLQKVGAEQQNQINTKKQLDKPLENINRLRSRKSISGDSLNYLMRLQTSQFSTSPTTKPLSLGLNNVKHVVQKEQKTNSIQEAPISTHGIVKRRQSQMVRALSNKNVLANIGFTEDSSKAKNYYQEHNGEQVGLGGGGGVVSESGVGRNGTTGGGGPQLQQPSQQQQQQNTIQLQIVTNNSKRISSSNCLPSPYGQPVSFKRPEQLYYYDFDKMMDFKFYFPHNNYPVVCKKKDNKRLSVKKLKQQVPQGGAPKNKSKKKSKIIKLPVNFSQ